jgi:hypothetical protein
MICFLTYGSDKGHKYFHDPRNEKLELLPECNLMIKNLNVILVRPFFSSCSSERKKGDSFASAIDESLQITESGETACCSTNELYESPSLFSSSVTVVATSKIFFIPSDISCLSKEPQISS